MQRESSQHPRRVGTDAAGASLRSQAQIEFVTKRFPEYEGKITGVVNPDITLPGAYDEIVQDVDAIIHAASPVVFTWEDPSEIIDPAVRGATGILASANKFGKRVKRVVLTSSKVAVSFEEQKEGDVFDEVSKERIFFTLV